MSEKVCDNRSVGVILTHKDKLLLIDRANPPYGLACVAGHVDEHGTSKQAAVAEVYEEVGIEIAESSLTPFIMGQCVDLACKRQGGDHHVWDVYIAESPTDEVAVAEREVAGYRWVVRRGLAAMLLNRARWDGPVLRQLEADGPYQELLEPVWDGFLSQYLEHWQTRA